MGYYGFSNTLCVKREISIVLLLYSMDITSISRDTNPPKIWSYPETSLKLAALSCSLTNVGARYAQLLRQQLSTMLLPHKTVRQGPQSPLENHCEFIRT
jgi:hypothetical protein